VDLEKILKRLVYDSTPSLATSNPYQVDWSVTSGWSSTYGAKYNDMRTGNTVVHDVYSNKYTNGGYSIVYKDFGKGYQPYLNFQGCVYHFWLL
jgi:hypothetical protein